MIIALVIKKGITNDVENFCYVVGKNPDNWEYSYCLPVAVAAFGGWKPVFNIPTMKRHVPFYPEGEIKKKPSKFGKLAFQWQWDYREGGGFTDYVSNDNASIEIAHYHYKNCGGNSFVLLRDITRLLDDRKCDYLVDFEKNDPG